MKYNRHDIMVRAWSFYRNSKLNIATFGEALHRAWIAEKALGENERRISEAKSAANVTEETDTWKGWFDRGFEVIHESKALFGADLIYGAKGDGAIYKARFFGASQVHAIA